VTPKPRLAFVLGIRPDVIRASLILEQLRSYGDVDVTFIWSGQHYSDNLKSVFFRELDVAPEEIDLGCSGTTDAEIVASVIGRLYPVLELLRPAAVVFLGDTNTTAGAIAAAQLNIPIVHIEGCMRSYDWRMPEEKYRTTIDHLSDVIYAYVDEYKEQGVREGLNGDNIVVVGNPIVDVLNRYYFARKEKFDALATCEFFRARGLERGLYYLMTCHRRENIGERSSLLAIIRLLEASPYPVYFPAGYRTQAMLRDFGLSMPEKVHVVDPIGYDEMLCLLVNSRGALTDSGTVVEETCVLGVPSLQIRKSTERPQVYDVGSSVKFDPAEPQRYPAMQVFGKLESLVGKTWPHTLGDGRSSERIAQDLRRRIVENDFARHKPEHYHVPIDRSFRDDGLGIG
jgi:UDP-N-acetylglucosamine 2-epimerase (non-hydrolysing)